MNEGIGKRTTERITYNGLFLNASASAGAVRHAGHIDHIGCCNQVRPQVPYGYFNSAIKTLPAQMQDLKGALQGAQGRHDEAIKLLLDTVERERNLGCWEPSRNIRAAAAYLKR